MPMAPPELHKSGEVVQVQIVRPVVIEGIKRHDDVEEFFAEGVATGRQHARGSRSSDSTSRISGFSGRSPRHLNHRSVARDLNAEFALEEDRGGGASAAKVEYPHSRLQIERGREPLGHPEWIRGPADAGKQPFRVVLRRAGKSLRMDEMV